MINKSKLKIAFSMYRTCYFKLYFKRFVVITFYVGCITFVIHRGYKCFGKYLSKPEGVEMSYDFIGNSLFPSFTFCSHNWNDNSPHRYNKAALKTCNISNYKEYAYEGRYIGSGHEYCSDPKKLQKVAGIGYKDLDIYKIRITTFDRFLNGFDFMDISNDSYFEWSNTFLDQNRGGCHTISFKKNVLKHGILWVRYELNSIK